MKKISIAALLLSLLVLNSCSNYLDINRDPSNPQLAEGFVLLPPMLSQMATNPQFDSRFIGKYIQTWGDASPNNSWDRMGYDAGSDNAGLIWRMNYWNLGANIELMLQDAQAKEKWDYSGVAKAISAYSWQTTTDYHGEIILKQAFEANRYVFDYDTQEEVYAYVRQRANDALTDLNRTDGAVSQASLARGDLVYKGDRTKWIKFVYGILARNAHHISNKATYKPDEVIDFCNKSLASNDDNFNVPFTAGGNSALMNPLGPTRSNIGTYRQTDFLLSLLDGRVFKGVVDPRLPVLATASPDGTYRGVQVTKGDPNNVNGNTKRIPTFWGVQANEVTTTTPGKYIYRDGASFPLLTYTEIQFIKSEAAFLKGDKAMALAAYQAGIGAAMDYAGIASADKAKYLASEAVAQSASALTLSAIMLQKYLALVGHGIIETWVDMRRYHYDANIYTGFTPPDATQLFPDNNGKLVYRVRPRYNSEYVWNRASLDKYGGNAPDYHTVEQWFSQK